MRKLYIVFSIAVILSLCNSCKTSDNAEVLVFNNGVDTIVISGTSNPVIDTMPASFFVTNYSSVPYKIIGVTASCNCTHLTTLDSIVKPGDSIMVKGYYINNKKLNTNAVITVRTNLPKMPFKNLYIVAR